MPRRNTLTGVTTAREVAAHLDPDHTASCEQFLRRTIQAAKAQGWGYMSSGVACVSDVAGARKAWRMWRGVVEVYVIAVTLSSGRVESWRSDAQLNDILAQLNPRTDILNYIVTDLSTRKIAAVVEFNR